jgi:hypothetical protein
LPLAQKIHDITDISCRLLFDNLATQDYKGWEAEGLAKEAKDHRDGNLEASRIAMACIFH